MLKSKGIITDLQRDFLKFFSKLPDSNSFYLTGGTALADFFLGHRKSYDLDLFTREKKLILPFTNLLREKIRKKLNFNLIKRFETFVEIEIKSKAEEAVVHLAYDSPFRLGKPVSSDIGIKVNDYKDIITDKLLAFFSRTEPRDAIDLFFILKKEDFWQLLNFAKKKDPGFDLYWLAVALNKVKEFPDDIKNMPVDMIAYLDLKELKNKFFKFAIEIMDKIKEGNI